MEFLDKFEIGKHYQVIEPEILMAQPEIRKVNNMESGELVIQQLFHVSQKTLSSYDSHVLVLCGEVIECKKITSHGNMVVKGKFCKQVAISPWMCREVDMEEDEEDEKRYYFIGYIYKEGEVFISSSVVVEGGMDKVIGKYEEISQKENHWVNQMVPLE